MSVQLTIEFADRAGAELALRAIEAYKSQLRAAIARTQRRLADFERRYNTTTVYFMEHMAAEDFPSGDLEYVDWAGETRLLTGLEDELAEMEHARYHLP